MYISIFSEVINKGFTISDVKFQSSSLTPKATTARFCREKYYMVDKFKNRSL